MGVEIERKFLVSGDDWRSLGKAVHYRQGYLSSTKERVVRVRTIDDRGFLTIKGITEGLSRLEFEYDIPGDDAGSQNLDSRRILRIDRALPVYGLTNTVDDATFHFRSNRYLGDAAGSLDDVAFLDTGDITENGATDIVLLEVQGQAHDAARELEKFHGHAVLYPVDSGDTVTNGDNGSGLVEVYTGLVFTNLVLDNLTDFFGFDLHLFSPLNGTF